MNTRNPEELYPYKQEKKVVPLAKQEIYEALGRLGIKSPDECNAFFRDYTKYFASCHGRIPSRYKIALKIKALFHSSKKSHQPAD